MCQKVAGANATKYDKGPKQEAQVDFFDPTSSYSHLIFWNVLAIKEVFKKNSLVLLFIAYRILR